MRITAKGQVTIPRAIRERAGLMPGADVEFKLEADGVLLVKADSGARHKMTRGEQLVARLRGKGAFEMTTDEILALMRAPPADEDAPRRK